MTPRMLLIWLVVVMLVLCFNWGATVRAFQAESAGEPEWARHIEAQLETVSRQVYLNTGTFTQRLDALDQRLANLSTRLTNDESGSITQPGDIGKLTGTVQVLYMEMTAIFGGVLAIIAGGLGLAWLYFKKAQLLAKQLETHRIMVADELKSHEAVVSSTLNQLVTQTNGMSEHLQALARSQGRAEGVAEGRAEGRAEGVK